MSKKEKSKLPKMIKQVGPITLGLEYVDFVHSRKGTAVCYANHLTGCNRVCLEWLDKDGDLKDMWVDETRLVDLDGNPVIAPEKKDNGPGRDPGSRDVSSAPRQENRRG